jgi:hypothetical protein
VDCVGAAWVHPPRRSPLAPERGGLARLGSPPLKVAPWRSPARDQHRLGVAAGFAHVKRSTFNEALGELAAVLREAHVKPDSAHAWARVWDLWIGYAASVHSHGLSAILSARATTAPMVCGPSNSAASLWSAPSTTTTSTRPPARSATSRLCCGGITVSAMP